MFALVLSTSEVTHMGLSMFCVVRWCASKELHDLIAAENVFALIKTRAFQLDSVPFLQIIFHLWTSQ